MRPYEGIVGIRRMKNHPQTVVSKNPSNNDYVELNKIKVPLADLRIQIVELMKQGFTEIPLADLLFIIQSIHRGAAPKGTGHLTEVAGSGRVPRTPGICPRAPKTPRF